MDTATISSKYQVVIPARIREVFKLKPGQRVRLIPYDNTIVIIPIVGIQSLRGIFKGMDTNFERDEEDRI